MRSHIAGVRLEPAGRPDPNGKDVFICLHCTGMMPMGRKVIHAFEGTPEEHWPPYRNVFTFKQQEDLFEYEVRVSQKYSDDISEFIARRMYEDRLGIRDPDLTPLSAQAFSLTAEFLSLRLDTSNYPMFPEEITEWLESHRRQFLFPESCLKTTLPCGNTYETVMAQNEALVFCLWLQEQKVGAGSQLLAGNLRPDRNGDIVEESQLEEIWKEGLDAARPRGMSIWASLLEELDNDDDEEL